MALTNPFKPTAGKTPPELIGRDDVTDEFIDGLDNGAGAPGRLMRVTGMRGMGKTAVLNELGTIASRRGWNVIDETASNLFTERLLQKLLPSTALSAASIQPELFGFKLGSIGFERMSVTLQDAMSKTAAHGGLLITLDEVQDAAIDEIRTLAVAVQHLIREDADIAFVFAGLSSMVEGVVNSKALTFLRRAVPFTLGPLSVFEVGDSIENTVHEAGMNIGTDIAHTMANATAGYPFMVQLVGYYAWQSASRRSSRRIEADDAAKGVRLARRRFEETVIEPALHHLPPSQARYLLAMAQEEGDAVRTAAIAERLEATTSETSVFRDRLIRAGLIDAAAWGKVRFAIPYMGDYLRANFRQIEAELADG